MQVTFTIFGTTYTFYIPLSFSELDDEIKLTFGIILITVVPLLVSVAYFTLIERKLLAAIQRRKGPNVVGIWGLLQPLADGFKLCMKEFIKPSSSNKTIFIISPIITFILSFVSWCVVPFDQYSFLVQNDLSLLLILSISSLSIYGIFMSGWSSNSKYSILGALRSSAQMIAYETVLTITYIVIGYDAGSFNVAVIVHSQEACWNIFTFAFLFLVAIVAMLAETNRHPFDLPEAEAELVSGYNVEYSGMFFAFFSLSEYLNMLLMSALMTILFLGGWLPPCAMLAWIPGSVWFSLKVSFLVTVFVVARGALPRYRYDQLMNLGWQKFIPFAFSYYFFMVSLFFILKHYFS